MFSTLKRSELPEGFEDRFWKRVDKSGACWVWIGPLRNDGYAQMEINGRKHLAHRISWSIEHGVVTGEHCVLHKCDNKPCVRPDHFLAGSRGDNNRDREAKGRGGRASGDRNGRRTKPECTARGERQGSAKLTEAAVKNMRHRFSHGTVTRHQLAAEYGVSFFTVVDVIRRRSWRHI